MNTTQPISNLFSSKKVYVGTSRLYGAGPLRILPSEFMSELTNNNILITSEFFRLMSMMITSESDKFHINFNEINRQIKRQIN